MVTARMQTTEPTPSPPTPPAPSTPPASRERRRELDWLRAFVVFGLIPFHTAVIFMGAQGDYVRNAQSSWLLARAVAFISFWGIPLLFFVSGAATRYALDARSNRQYVEERITRLLIPFLFALVTILPLQVYIGYLGQPGLHVSYWQYYGQFLHSLLDILHGVLPARGADWVGHLWFIPPLLVVSLLALPLFRFLRTPHGQRIITRIGDLAEHRGALILLGLPFGMNEVLLRAGWPRPDSAAMQAFDNWPGFVLFALFYLGGYLVYGNQRIEHVLRTSWLTALVLGVASWLLVEAAATFTQVLPHDNMLLEALVRLLRGYVSWFWVAAIAGFGMRYLASASNRFVKYLTEATFPIYVLHMPILTIIGYVVVRWQLSIGAKFVFITLTTLVVTVLIYELLVRHLAPLRFVFGMSIKPSQRSTDHRSTPPTVFSPPGTLSLPVKGHVDVARRDTSTTMSRV